MRGFLISCAALAAACVGERREPITTTALRHFEPAPRAIGGPIDEAAVDYLRSVARERGVDLATDDDFVVTQVLEEGGLRHARMTQLHAGVAVLGSEVVVHADDSAFLGLNGALTEHLDGFDVVPVIPPLGDSAVLLVRPEAGGARLVWWVTRFTPAPRLSLVDARDGEVIDEWSGVRTLEQASGPGGNANKAFDWLSELDVEPDGELFAMETERLRTGNRQAGDDVIRGNLAFMPDQAANDAHGYAEVTLDMLREWMGRDSLDGFGMRVESRVHDETYCFQAPANACWDGRRITYGDGGDPFYPLSGALDVVAHELGHGFTEFHSDLGWNGQSAALNEHFSDVAGTAAEFYREGESGDFLIGEDIVRGDGALRSMCDPPADGRSIGHMRDYRDDLDPHLTNGIPNRAFCLAVGRTLALTDPNSIVSAVLAVGHVWFTANAAYWISNTSFQGACQGTLDAARALGHPGEVVEALAASWADVGVDCRDAAAVCDGDGDCDWGDGETCATCAEDCGGCWEECSAWKWAKCHAGLDDCSRCGRPAGCGDRDCTGDETDTSCAADCGCASLGCEDVAPFGCWCDSACVERGDCCADRAEVCRG